jgi:hypothetical protein
MTILAAPARDRPTKDQTPKGRQALPDDSLPCGVYSQSAYGSLTTVKLLSVSESPDDDARFP